MAKSKLDELQSEINKAFLPLEKRRETYLSALKTLRLKLRDYFFNDKNKQELLEAAVDGQPFFNWQDVKPGMATCLVEEFQLVARAEELQSQSAERLSITAALDFQIAQSGLPLVLEKMGYAFQPVTPYTPKAQLFMQQFAGALSIYRVYLSVYEIYCGRYEFLKVDAHLACLDKATALQNEVQQNQRPVATLFQEAKSNARAIKQLLGNLRDQEDVFDFSMKLQAANLTTQFELAAKVIETCYKRHPNDSVLFFVKDSEWQCLLKGIAVELFDNQYTYSSYGGTLTILPKLMSTVIAEMTQFYLTMADRQIDYRLGLLEKALSINSDIITELRMQAARDNLSLAVKAETTTSGSNDTPVSLYALYGTLRPQAPRTTHGRLSSEPPGLTPHSFS